jgi:hypothetical protein
VSSLEIFFLGFCIALFFVSFGEGEASFILMSDVSILNTIYNIV